MEGGGTYLGRLTFINPPPRKVTLTQREASVELSSAERHEISPSSSENALLQMFTIYPCHLYSSDSTLSSRFASSFWADYEVLASVVQMCGFIVE